VVMSRRTGVVADDASRRGFRRVARECSRDSGQRDPRAIDHPEGTACAWGPVSGESGRGEARSAARMTPLAASRRAVRGRRSSRILPGQECWMRGRARRFREPRVAADSGRRGVRGGTGPGGDVFAAQAERGHGEADGGEAEGEVGHEETLAGHLAQRGMDEASRTARPVGRS